MRQPRGSHCGGFDIECMANVIPNEIRLDLESHARARYIVVGAIMALLCAAVAFLLLLPSYLALTIRSNESGSSSQMIASAQQQSDATALKHATALLNVLSPIVLASSTPTAVIGDVLSVRPAGVRITQIIYHAGSPASLMLTGSADSSGEIGAYRDKLSADPRFLSVSVPVGALVGTDGGRFSITLSGTF